jgi:hypothetical protein
MTKASINEAPLTQVFITLLRITCFFVFAGRAYQHLVWDAPFRTLLWDQYWMQGIIESLTSLTWEQYTTSIQVDKYIQGSIQATGWLYAICALLSLFIKSSMKRAGYLLLAGSVSLGLLAFLQFKDKFYQYGELMEMGIQVFTPVFLFIALFTGITSRRLMLIAKSAVALTFIGHGLYAWGYYPVPGHFIDMFINVLGFTEEFSLASLKVAAVLDFAAAILIFIPRTSRISLMYCVLWGGLTASARILSGFNSDLIADSLNQFTYETAYRLAHGLIPLWIFLNEGGRIRLKNLLTRKRTNTTTAAPAAALIK